MLAMRRGQDGLECWMVYNPHFLSLLKEVRATAQIVLDELYPNVSCGSLAYRNDVTWVVPR